MRVLSALIDVYSLLIIAAVLMSWVPMRQRNAFTDFIHAATEPVLAPARRLIPPMGGLDLSPMLVLIVLQVLKGIL